MKKNKNIFITIVICIITLVSLYSCSYIENSLINNEKKEIIVAIGDNFLYKKDIETLVPDGTNPSDSALIVDGYIKRWATNILILENAERNIINADEIDKLVEDYRRTLTIHYYQQNMVNERVALPTDTEASEFYNNNQSLFLLKEPVAKGALISIPKNVNIQKLKKNFKDIEDNIEKVEKFAVSYATNYSLFNETWQPINNIKDKIGIPIEIKSTGIYETQDSLNIILINITDFIKSGEVAPLEMVIEESRNELYNQNKMNYLRNFGRDIYNYALRHNQIEFYNTNTKE